MMVAMNADLLAICNKHLPGRDPSEDQQLQKFMRAILSEERKLDGIDIADRSTISGKTRQLERGIEQRRQVDRALDELVAQFHAGRQTDDHSDDRYKVHCRTPRGNEYLGGCASLGDGEARAQWFAQLLSGRTPR